MTRLDPRKADCASCQALCCVALDIEWKNFQKPANEACPHLTKDFRCGVWDDLEAHGCATCRDWSCYNVGPEISKIASAGSSWRDNTGLAITMFITFQDAYSSVVKSIRAELKDIADEEDNPG